MIVHWVFPFILTFRVVSSFKSNENFTSDQFEIWSNLTCRADQDPISGGWRVICEEFDIFDTIPIFPKWISKNIISLIIKNQPNLIRLTGWNLVQFPELIELSISNTNLTWIEPRVFNKNRYLRKVELNSNSLKTLDWRWMVNLRNAQLEITDNPFECNCSIFWLASWNSDLIRKKSFKAPDGTDFYISTNDAMTLPKRILNWDELKCFHINQKSQIYLSIWKSINSRGIDIGNPHVCALPLVEMDPKSINVDESDQMMFQCSINSNQPLDLDFLQLFQLNVVDKNETKNKMKLEKQIRYSGRSILTIVISNITQGQMGWYVCLGLSVSGPNFHMASLIVQSKPNLRLLSKNRTRSIDHYTDTFHFTIYSFPSLLNLTWFKNDQSIDFTRDANKHAYLIISEDSDHLRKRGFFYVSRFTFIIRLRFAQTFFIGDYSLMACNSLGCGHWKFITYNKTTLPQIQSGLSVNIGQSGRIVSPTEKRPTVTESSWILALICMSLGVCMCGMALAFCCVHQKRRHWTITCQRWWCWTTGRSNGRPAGGRLLELDSYTTNDVYQPFLSAAVPLVPVESLRLIRTLGEGAFGQVYLAYCDFTQFPQRHQLDQTQTSTSNLESGTGNTSTESRVAAKALKQFNLDRSQEIAREAELMARLDHPNIVTFYGTCLRGRNDLLLIYEYMELGDLRGFLTEHGPYPELQESPMEDYWCLIQTQLIDISRQIAQGLIYLHENHFVHRDLACRNCLVKSPLIVKLSDFGMTRDIYSSDYYRLTHKAPLPVRWLPPESLLYGRFSDLSDVWSFGVVVWEISTYGKMPWCEYSNVQVMEKVNGGEILVPPEDCPDVLSGVMMECWKRAPSERIKLSEVVRRLTVSVTQ